MKLIVCLLVVLLLVVHLSPTSADDYRPADDHGPAGDDHHPSDDQHPAADQHRADDPRPDDDKHPADDNRQNGDDDGRESSQSWEGDTTLTIQTVLDDLPFDDLLSFGHYRSSCPDLEGIINRKLKEWITKDYGLAASLMRLHFHDCSVRGCDASILLNHEGSERSAMASKTLRGFEVIDAIKGEVEKACPKTVSCADILTAATRDATVMVGGPYWMVPYGRKDGRVSIAKDAEMVPMGHENITALVELFQSQGLDVLDLVVLSGAHTIGRSSCASIQDRLYNFNGKGISDPSIDEKYLIYLKSKCRWGSEYVDLDAITPMQFDTLYYSNLQRQMGVLSTDQLLYSDSRTSFIVSALAREPWVFHNQFGVSMAKLGNVQVLTGQDEGEIRTNCNFVNSY